MQRRLLYAADANSLYFLRVTARRLTQRQERDSLRRTRVKIEFFTASRRATCPRHSNSKNKNPYAYALATGGRHVLHGAWWHLRPGKKLSRGRFQHGNTTPAIPAGTAALSEAHARWP